MAKKVPEEALKLVADVWKGLSEERKKKLQGYTLDAVTDLLRVAYGEGPLRRR